jgi:hypothetical protein
MRQVRIALSVAAATLAIAAMLAPDRGLAQGQLPRPPQLPPPGGQMQQPPRPGQPPPAAPVRPYKAVAVTLPTAMNDASFEAFRKTLADIAKRKDRAALAKLIVAQGFFWLQDKDLADKRKPGIDNLAKAIDLDAKDGSGWDMLNGYASDPTGMPMPERRGVICAPSDPTFNVQELQTLGRATKTQPSDWAYPVKDGIEVRAAAAPNATVVEKIGMYFIRVLPDEAPPNSANAAPFEHVALPSGKTGYVPADALVPLGGDQMCYLKDAAGWKITGYIGGADQ